MNTDEIYNLMKEGFMGHRLELLICKPYDSDNDLVGKVCREIAVKRLNEEALNISRTAEQD